MDSTSSADSYGENAAHMGSPQMRTQQQMYMMPDESRTQPMHEQSQDQRQSYFVPVPMLQTPYGYVPLQTGSPMGQESPMRSQGTPMAMHAPAGMPMMQAFPAMPNGEPSTPTNMPMQPMVSPASPQGVMMQLIPSPNGDSMQMMVIPAGMPLPGMEVQGMPMAPQGYMYKPVNEAHQTKDQSGEKKGLLLEGLLPGGVRRAARRQEPGKKVFVGGLNPSTTGEDLRAYFSEWGAVTDCCVISDSSTKASRGFGFVEFEEMPEGLFDKPHIIDQRRCSVREYGNSSASQ
jgi:hypothetical protein